MRCTVDGDAELGRWEWEEQLNMLPSHTIQYFLMHTISMYYSTVLQYFNENVIFWLHYMLLMLVF